MFRTLTKYEIRLRRIRGIPRGLVHSLDAAAALGMNVTALHLIMRTGYLKRVAVSGCWSYFSARDLLRGHRAGWWLDTPSPVLGPEPTDRDGRRRYREESRRFAAYGRLIGFLSPEPCEECGAAKVHGHHDDYSKPLSVRWLCPSCHNQFHACQRRAARRVAA